MKNIVACATTGVLICLGTGHVNAAQTNLVQTIQFNALIYTQADPVTNATGTIIKYPTVTTPFGGPKLIQLLGQATTNHFSPVAKLKLISPVTGARPIVVVQDETNRVDVSSYVSLTQRGDVTVESTVRTVSTGAEVGTVRELFGLRLRSTGNALDLPLHFDTRGLAVFRTKTVMVGGLPVAVNTTSSKLDGDGGYSQGGNSDFLIRLDLKVIGGSVEVVN